MNRKTRRKLAVGLIDEISQECEAWLCDPSSAYPFLDMVFSETPCFANERDANVITQSLERCARLGELLETVGRPGSAARLEKAVNAIKKELAKAQRGVDCGRSREQCLAAVKHTVRRFVARLNIVKSELASAEEPKPEAGGQGAQRIREGKCHHTTDFSTVVWFGEEYHFNETQGKCVEILWAEWEKDPEGKRTVHQRTIRDSISSENADFRLIQVFRTRDGMHRAWGRMIHKLGRGLFYLAKPARPTPNKKRPRKRKTKRGK